ncbi:MAG: hypothetical protein KTR31_33740 [Myxococcales bacterium]|nr:hypothetical protein [Myxococcales bacterium]
MHKEHLVPVLTEEVTQDGDGVSFQLLPGVVVRDGVAIAGRVRVELPQDASVGLRYPREETFRSNFGTHTLAPRTDGPVRLDKEVGVTFAQGGRPVHVDACVGVEWAPTEGLTLEEGGLLGGIRGGVGGSGRPGQWLIEPGTPVLWQDGSTAGEVSHRWVRHPSEVLSDGPAGATCFTYHWSAGLRQLFDKDAAPLSGGFEDADPVVVCVPSDAIGITTKDNAEPLVFHHSELKIRRRAQPAWPAGQRRDQQPVRCKVEVTFDYRGRVKAVEERDREACPEPFADEVRQALMQWRLRAKPRANGSTIIGVTFSHR